MRSKGFAPVAQSVRPGVLLGLLVAGVMALWPSPAPAVAAEQPRIGDRPLSPAAGWHGRAIQKAHRHPESVLAAGRDALKGWSAGPVRLGAGLTSERGSQRVREIQRHLKRIGYAIGPVDGRFGRRTQAALGWFQHKHGLAVTGVATAATVRHVRERGRPGATPREATPETRQTDTGQSRERPAETQKAAASASGDDDGSDAASWLMPVAIIAAAIALTALAFALWRRLRRRDTDDATVYELWVEGHSEDPEIGGFRGVVKAVSVHDDPRPRGWTEETQYLVEDPTKPDPFWVPAAAVVQLGAARQEPAPPANGRARAIGYVNTPPDRRDVSPADVSAATAAIDATCHEHGWELIQIVRDSAATQGRGERRPGLSFALERVASGEASCLIAGRLGHLARSVSELSDLLDWFSEHEATLVVCDIELDTSTGNGRRTAQTLGAVSAWERQRADHTREPHHT
jgi:peptidoglycan hydrolase-like protein with peptidoglycan-binding domain